ncbi:glutaminyl-tRNA synthetase [Pseudovirgaria hyperparasitica]|uniref:glutamine--tRNA ligase n=1 Tax=Pseudovirgaria hyperparasitica TaxID=470096 RepID=A0A6A6VRN6_9PEZI|nr:glutaminyl-tRNA synthetase [Pseudovirgaria hyperparasitica]KAF2752863.1 glutaminyl-tRNA synthetase [Pseudovirgaria hyperparasitica]
MATAAASPTIDLENPPPFDEVLYSSLEVLPSKQPEGISKGEWKKFQKKLEKKRLTEKNKAAGLPTRAKEPKPQEAQTKTVEPEQDLQSRIFNTTWLKTVYDEKPRPDVITRFPPEPNGYLHIGHAKAITVNFGFAQHYKGKCYLRYDDTNPVKEEEKYFTAIQDMVKWLGFEPCAITYSSDHFDELYNLAEKLISKDCAYVCHCSAKEINLQRGGPDNRGKRYACADRSRPVEESLAEFRAMRDGKYKEGEAFLRMKQKLTDPEEGNPQMWDLPAYRVKNQNYHHRTGDKWRIYPTYDFTHCICDAFENISHSLCTSEFRQSRVSYDWLLEQLDMKIPNSEEKGPMQREYGRLNVQGTILSKRNIQKLVEGTVAEKRLPDGTTEMRKIEPQVRGWDDPRLFTLVALRRRGIPAMAMRTFVLDLGVTDNKTDTEVHKFESTIQDYLHPRVARLMLVLEPVKVVIEDLSPDDEFTKEIAFGTGSLSTHKRPVTFSREIYIDSSDFKEEDDADFKRLAPGKTVRLINAMLIRATTFTKDLNGNITEIRAVKGQEADMKSNSGTIHWVDVATAVPVTARKYSSLFNSGDLDWSEGGYVDKINPNSELIFSNAFIEQGFSSLGKQDRPVSENPDAGSDDIIRFQGMRVGYFCIDPEKEGDKIVLNQIVPLKESKPKDEKAKPKAA